MAYSLTAVSQTTTERSQQTKYAIYLLSTCSLFGCVLLFCLLYLNALSVVFRSVSRDMDIFMDEDFSVTGNTSHEIGQEKLEGIKTQGLNRSDPLDMFIGMELLLRFKPLFMPLYCIVVIVAGVGNSFLLACILADKKLHNATNFFIGNLAAGDLLMCLSCVPLTASYAFDSHGWAFGRPLCHLVPLLQCAAVFASVLSLTAIAVDRYIVVGEGLLLFTFNFY